jgi:hypothetical protein
VYSACTAHSVLGVGQKATFLRRFIGTPCTQHQARRDFLRRFNGTPFPQPEVSLLQASAPAPPSCCTCGLASLRTVQPRTPGTLLESSPLTETTSMERSVDTQSYTTHAPFGCCWLCLQAPSQLLLVFVIYPLCSREDAPVTSLSALYVVYVAVKVPFSNYRKVSY